MRSTATCCHLSATQVEAQVDIAQHRTIAAHRAILEMTTPCWNSVEAYSAFCTSASAAILAFITSAFEASSSMPNQDSISFSDGIGPADFFLVLRSSMALREWDRRHGLHRQSPALSGRCPHSASAQTHPQQGGTGR